MVPHTIHTTEYPQLVLLKQTSLCEEFLPSKNGQKTLHTVVKNSPFTVSFGFENSAKPVDLNKFNFDVTLHYDSENNKEVDYLKTKPIVVKTSVNPPGTKLSVEVRIKVLTSQLEDSLFIVMVRGYDQITNEVVLSSSSDAIKVISKSDQVKKPKQPSQKKRNITDSLGEYLTQIETTSQEQARLLASLCTNNVPLIENVKSVVTKPTIVPVPIIKTQKDPDFQTAFKDFLKASSQLPPDEKRQKLSRVLSTTPMSSSFLELVDLLGSEMNRDQGPKANDGKHGYNLFCSCPGCPYLKELGRIEGFYNDIFTLQNNT